MHLQFSKEKGSILLSVVVISMVINLLVLSMVTRIRMHHDNVYINKGAESLKNNVNTMSNIILMDMNKNLEALNSTTFLLEENKDEKLIILYKMYEIILANYFQHKYLQYYNPNQINYQIVGNNILKLSAVNHIYKASLHEDVQDKMINYRMIEDYYNNSIESVDLNEIFLVIEVTGDILNVGTNNKARCVQTIEVGYEDIIKGIHYETKENEITINQAPKMILKCKYNQYINN
ncbi:hypothetical protein AN639_03710 [Candidatus Epulonipiscium fishelsonii]|uniref:Uncharacterized protein n=1 Tax=Candidatus Epulonipiscium fishelsonii TaxID=77094 RepID=A0ACC8X7E3_9FIRM|nr:hypothetical protein AN396_12815 [Epulopiscium sp. SCG-B11WGA-EpuloA1]ONI41468.1 hypothetical protein AN639_03710 [Epulopiscium sp. SCG-B05WGA-EpuloA1]